MGVQLAVSCGETRVSRCEPLAGRGEASDAGPLMPNPVADAGPFVRATGPARASVRETTTVEAGPSNRTSVPGPQGARATEQVPPVAYGEVELERDDQIRVERHFPHQIR